MCIRDSPPTLTEQVLFPEKYLAGELETGEPPTVAVPSGVDRIAAGSIGAGMLWFLLSDVHGEVAALQLVEAWKADGWVLFDFGEQRCLNATIEMDTSGAHVLLGRALDESLRATGADVGVEINPTQIVLSACR